VAKAAAKKPGRPPAYKPEFADQAAKLCRLGATDAEIAAFFEKDQRTINRRKVDGADLSGPKRREACSDMKVADRLHQRAMGLE
jgi:hypothetical protein